MRLEKIILEIRVWVDIEQHMKCQQTLIFAFSEKSKCVVLILDVVERLLSLFALTVLPLYDLARLNTELI